MYNGNESSWQMPFIIGFAIGLVFMVCLATWVGPFNRSDLMKAQTECEKSLPRDQKCIYEFVPNKGKI